MDLLHGLLFQAISSGALLVIFYIFYGLSRRLGEALQIKPYYHLFTIGSVFIFILMLIQYYIVFNHEFISADKWTQYLFAVSALLAIGVTFGFFAAIKYWGWLVKEISR